MLVVPEGIGAKALFINKIDMLFNMRDFSDPGYRDIPEGTKRVKQDLAGIHVFGAVLLKRKAEITWSNALKIIWAGKKIPTRIKRDGKLLSILDAIHTGNPCVSFTLASSCLCNNERATTLRAFLKDKEKVVGGRMFMLLYQLKASGVGKRDK